MFDYPYQENGLHDPPPGETWQEANIRVTSKLNYKQAYELDPNFGVSLQCGQVYLAGIADERNIFGYELMYETNLALMNGAKFLSLYTYFAQRKTNDCNSGWTCHAIVDILPDGSLYHTGKYDTLLTIISPRLKDLMGKTLKKLSPIDQILKVPLNTQFSFSNFINKIIKGDCTTQGSQSGEYDYDLGFFTDSLNRDYFMIISRWYNGGCDPALTIKLKPDYYNNYNIKVVDFINNQTYNTNRFGSISSALVRGDAGFWGVFPILQYGGDISANDTTFDGETLLDDLTIESGATLTVNGTYNAKANITVKSGGKIIAVPNGKIIFAPGKKIIIDGTTEIKGSSFINKLTLEFASSEKGIDVLPGSSLTLTYCNITGAYYGIVTRTGTPSYLNITNCNIGFGSTGIVLNGNYYSGGPSPTAIISNCNFTTWGTGLSVTNNNSVIISQNSFASCGISLLNVPAAYIQGNNISSGSNESYSGIFFNNSGGYIRSNIIKNRVNGIHLANSSPDVGGNIIEDNYRHGLYTGSGSIPNLVGYIQINPPLYFPLSGYNTIRNNGNNTQSGSENDGSEIYLSGTNIALRDGCNDISDDRQSTPNMSTLLIINGSLAPGGGRQLDARNNYWGTTTPTNSRFGLLSVLFTPYYDGPCPLPDGSGGSEEMLVLKTSAGEVVDTIYAAEGVPENFTTLEVSYAEADNYFATGNIDLAKPLYEQIVSSNYTTEEKLPAYNKLYTIGNLTGEGENYFNSLQTTFNDIANAETDTLLKKIYNQNAIKCDVSKAAYLTAISKFDNIIQQNPNSAEAIYAEIDIITTALNLDTTNSQLGKMGSGKYLVKGTSDYLSRLNDILQSKFGINSEEKEQIIPKEYSLHQNYPNPFNPTTTIKFDIPNDGLVQLEIFDILGRRITTLVEEYKPAGSYEQVFNASALASGVYVYKLQAGDFISSKKMILLK